MTTKKFNQIVILEIRRRMRQARTDKATDWPSVESQQAYWRERDKNLDRIEATTQWYDEQGEKL